MTFIDSFLPEFDTEMASTRKLLARVPAEKWDWKPHPKSRTSLGPRDSVLLLYAGGGGYGDPKKRAREAVLEDLRHGYITAGAAKTIYGVE